MCNVSCDRPYALHSMHNQGISSARSVSNDDHVSQDGREHEGVDGWEARLAMQGR
jgi:hypothetical protein